MFSQYHALKIVTFLTHMHTHTSQNKQTNKKPKNRNLTHGKFVENQMAIESTGQSTYSCCL